MTAKPRILLVIGQLGGGGAERQLVHFLRHAHSAIDARALLLQPREIWLDEIRELTSELYVARFAFPLLRLVEFLDVLRETQPQLVHCWHTFPVVYAVGLKPVHRVPVVVNLRGDITRDPRTAEPRSYFYTRFLRWSDMVISNSRHSLDRLRAERVPLPQSRVIPNGIELPARAARQTTTAGIARVVGIGSLKPLKNWSQLIRACAELKGRGCDVTPTIFGEGDQREELAALSARLGYDPAEVLPGFRNDLGALLGEFDLLVHPSLSEGLPNAVLEGLAAGLPVLASDLRICRELAERGRCVELYPVGDATACVRALGALIDDPARRRELGECGREFVRREFDNAQMARSYLQVYEELLRD